MTDTRYYLTRTLRNETEARAIVMESMDGYDASQYEPDIQAGKVDEVAREEWANVWSVNNTDVFATREAAEAAREDSRIKIVEVTLDDVADALTNLFGAE